MRNRNLISAVALATVIILSIGCSSKDARLAEFAQDAIQQQARQNEAMAHQSRQVTEQSHELAKTARSLVEQDAAARREMIEAHSNLQLELYDERAKLDTQRQELNIERQAVAKAAVRAPVIAQAILVTGAVLAALLPLLVTAYALQRIPDPEPTDPAWSTLLLENLDVKHEPGTALPPATDFTTARLNGPGSNSEPTV